MPVWLRIVLPAGAAIAILLLVILLQSATSRAESAERDLRVKTAEADQQKKRADQLEQAALQRLADQAAVDAMGKDYDDAIDAAANGAPDASAVALGCERLRRAGASSDTFKRVCGGH
ncbi:MULTISPECIES: hypothetical protein [unclassified Sphingomonas]|uniref:hypothetical protein n=1 Tax=unclassified Sphingomonas TaxID=196159 RepID=UPI00092A256C|nr:MULTISPECIES: hypothetical protein [unclassified Sphingomonas]MBN8848143.1 hypothetical protein [Sphingomonas sp.]OJV30640.1 MAG: hypothetical protein BGO24_07965 [Sphingomonas sp. 67-36]